MFLKAGEVPRKRKNWTRLDTHQHISIMLFAVSFGFVLLNLPYAIKTLFQRQFAKKNKIHAYLYHTEDLFRMNYTKSEIYNSIYYEFASNLTHFLLDLNYITNFFLYFFSGERFRNELLILLHCKKNYSMSQPKTTLATAQPRNELLSMTTSIVDTNKIKATNQSPNTTKASSIVSNKKVSITLR